MKRCLQTVQRAWPPRTSVGATTRRPPSHQDRIFFTMDSALGAV
jgi:hypothetical protein